MNTIREHKEIADLATVLQERPCYMAPPKKRAQPKPGTFAHTLATERERLKLTQLEMAQKLWAMPYRTYQSIELADRQPPAWVQAALLEKIARLK